MSGIALGVMWGKYVCMYVCVAWTVTEHLMEKVGGTKFGMQEQAGFL